MGGKEFWHNLFHGKILTMMWCHHTFANCFLLLFLITLPLSPYSLELQPRCHNIDNFLWHHSLAETQNMWHVFIACWKHMILQSQWNKYLYFSHGWNYQYASSNSCLAITSTFTLNPWERYELSYHLNYGLNITTTFLWQDDFSIK